jgi:hypothetical protein
MPDLGLLPMKSESEIGIIGGASGTVGSAEAGGTGAPAMGVPGFGVEAAGGVDC